MRHVLWTTDNVRVGLERFIAEHGRLPTALEMDRCTYLPSSRLIQKSHGGLQALRKELGYADTHLGHGTFRSKIAHMANYRGRSVEVELEMVLREMFGEVFVHTERIFGTSKRRLDFYVFAPEGNFGVDVFYPADMRSLQSNVNIKSHKYAQFVEPLYLVVANKNIRQEMLDQYAVNRRGVLPSHTHMLTIPNFLACVRVMNTYEIPVPKKSGNLTTRANL